MVDFSPIASSSWIANTFPDPQRLLSRARTRLSNSCFPVSDSVFTGYLMPSMSSMWPPIVKNFVIILPLALLNSICSMCCTRLERKFKALCRLSEETVLQLGIHHGAGWQDELKDTYSKTSLLTFVQSKWIAGTPTRPYSQVTPYRGTALDQKSKIVLSAACDLAPISLAHSFIYVPSIGRSIC